MTNPEIAKMIDHTFLGPAGRKDAVAKLCREAKRYGFASVCVNPCEVASCASILKGSGVRVCTVIDFPLGQGTVIDRCLAASDAIASGAQELDVVVNQRLLKYEPKKCLADLKWVIRACRDTAGEGTPPVTKLILECCNLTKAEIARGCRLAKKAGFDFVKTSTGFAAGGATVEDVKLMRKTVGKKMGVKAAGGIRTRADAEALVAAGASRLGCSAGVAIMKGLK